MKTQFDRTWNTGARQRTWIDASVTGPWAVENTIGFAAWGIINTDTGKQKTVGPVHQPRARSTVNYFDRAMELANARNQALLDEAKNPPFELQVVLQDTEGFESMFTYRKRKSDGKLISRRDYQDRGYGKDTHTDSCTIAGDSYSGNMWRFFEGMLGIEGLFATLEQGEDLTEFANKYASTTSDDEALKIWDETFRAES